MATKKPTHFRTKLPGVSLPGAPYHKGDVVAIEGLDFTNPKTADAIVGLCRESGNTYGPVETGVVDADGVFMPVPEPKSEEEEAGEPAEG